MTTLEVKESKRTVAKANDLVRKTRYMLPVAEQRTLSYIISMINTPYINNNNFEYIFPIRDYIKECGLSVNNGRIYGDVKRILKSLSDRSFYMTLENGDEVLVRWVSKVWLSEKKGAIKVRLDEDLLPYLIELKDNFFTYQFEYVKGMKSHFSFRLYEIIKSYGFLERSFELDLDALKQAMMVGSLKSYNNFFDFRRRVLEIAVKEINEMTDLQVNYFPKKTGKKVTSVKFSVQKKQLQKTIVTEKNKKEEGIEKNGQIEIEGMDFEELVSKIYGEEVYQRFSELDVNQVNLLLEIMKDKIPDKSLEKQIQQLYQLYLEMLNSRPENKFKYLKKMIEKYNPEQQVRAYKEEGMGGQECSQKWVYRVLKTGRKKLFRTRKEGSGRSLEMKKNQVGKFAHLIF